jgi:hypothetical protein
MFKDEILENERRRKIYAAIEAWYGSYSAGGIYSWVMGES